MDTSKILARVWYRLPSRWEYDLLSAEVVPETDRRLWDRVLGREYWRRRVPDHVAAEGLRRGFVSVLGWTGEFGVVPRPEGRGVLVRDRAWVRLYPAYDRAGVKILTSGAAQPLDVGEDVWDGGMQMLLRRTRTGGCKAGWLARGRVILDQYLPAWKAAEIFGRLQVQPTDPAI